MKKYLLLAVASLSLSLFAADEITISGEGKCAKCALKEKDACQNVVEVTKDGKKKTYYFVNNKVSQDFHKNVCTGPKKVKATGTVKEADGKLEFTAAKIELDKDK